jgi:hypothetical protein
MKLKLKKFRNLHQKSFVYLCDSGKTYAWNKVDQVLEVPSDVAYKLLSNCADMLESYGEQKHAPIVEVVKRGRPPKTEV